MVARLRQLIGRLANGNGEPSRRQPLIGLFQIGGVFAVVMLAVVVSREPEAEDAAQRGFSPASRETPIQLVNLIQPASQDSTVTIETTGVIDVRSYVALTTQVTGKVETLSPAMRNGGTFAAGEILMQLERTDFELAVAQAEAEVASASASLELQEAQRDAAIANYALLHPGDDVPPLVARTPQIDQAKAQLASARARLELARTDLDRTRFSLPFAGRVVESTVEIGQVVNKAQSVGRAFSLDAIEASVPVSTDDLARLAPIEGRTATVINGNTQVTATIDRVSAELEERTRFATLFLTVGDVSQMKPGAFVKVSVDGPALDQTFMLPENVEQIGGTVWIANNGALESRKLHVRGRAGDELVVDAFDYADGIVLGAVPGAYEGLAVRDVATDRQQVVSRSNIEALTAGDE